MTAKKPRQRSANERATTTAIRSARVLHPKGEDFTAQALQAIDALHDALESAIEVHADALHAQAVEIERVMAQGCDLQRVMPAYANLMRVAVGAVGWARSSSVCFRARDYIDTRARRIQNLASVLGLAGDSKCSHISAEELFTVTGILETNAGDIVKFLEQYCAALDDSPQADAEFTP